MVVPAGLHRVVWTLPYESACNPIEFCWSIAKGHAAKVGDAKSSIESSRAALRDGMYGSTTSKGITPEFCLKSIDHLKKVLNGWIAECPRLCTAIPGDAKAFAHITPAVRAAYGAIAAAHRSVRKRKSTKDPGAGDDDGDNWQDSDASDSSDSDDDGGAVAAVSVGARGSGVGASAAGSGSAV